MKEAGLLIRFISWLVNIKNRLNRSNFDKPSFFITGWSRYGRDAGINIIVSNKEDAYFIVENVLFKTEDGAISALDYKHKISEFTIVIPSEEQYFGVKGNIIINYKLKNNSKHTAKSPEIITAEKYNKELEMEIPLNIINEINDFYFI